MQTPDSDSDDDLKFSMYHKPSSHVVSYFDSDSDPGDSDNDQHKYSKPSYYEFSKDVYRAATRGWLQTLSDIFPNPNIKFNGQTPLITAVKNNQYSAIKFLLERGALPDMGDDNGVTPLMIAVENQDLQSANILLDYNASISVNDDNGDTVLSRAVNSGNPDMIKLLLSKPNLNEVGKDGRTLLISTMALGHKDVLPYLIKYGASIDQQGENERSALHIAVIRNLTEVIKFLLSHGANPNLRDAYGKTPLILVINRSNDPKIVKDLLEHKADPRIRDHYGKNVYDYFKEKWDEKSETLREIKKLLDDHRVKELKQIGEYFAVIPSDLVRLIVEAL